MIYQIESEDLIVQVKLKGMELCSIQSKTNGKEYLWQGDPQYWTGQAPVLFPIIGALNAGKTSFQNQDYLIPKHGFIRNSNLGKLIQQEANRLVFLVESSPETKAVYPFDFSFELTFELSGNALKVSHRVKNQGSGPMYYSLGAHPAFNLDLTSSGKLEDYSVVFPEEETDHTWWIAEEGLIGGKGELTLDHTKEIQLNEHIFDGDALIFKQLKSRYVSLNHMKKGPFIAVDFEDFDYLGIWAKPGAPYVCLEPWLGIADSVVHSGKLTDKEGIRKLAPGTSEIKAYTIRILD
ncbi:aldose 1-epimerase family protein [Algoriphagus aestuarii]|nr:aldose 1-epimerase family protein [Algoriphagus aestuarii]